MNWFLIICAFTFEVTTSQDDNFCYGPGTPGTGNFRAAVTSCAGYGGWPTTMQKMSPQVIDDVTAAYASEGHDLADPEVWIGLHRPDFLDLSGQPFMLADLWASTDPNEADSCMRVDRSGEGYAVFDRDCARSYKAVCQMPNPGECPSLWDEGSLNPGYCYQITAWPSDHTSAKILCGIMHASHLLRLSHYDDFHQLLDMYSSSIPVWVDYTRASTSVSWTWLGYLEGDVHGSAPWGVQTPATTGSQCAAYDGIYLHQRACNDNKAFVCEIPVRTTYNESPGCQPNPCHHGGWCIQRCMTSPVTCRCPDGFYGPYCEEIFPVQMVTTSDDRLQVYVDGIMVEENWKTLSTINITEGAQVVATKSVDGGAGAYFVAYFSNGLITDASWKCSYADEPGWEGITFVDSHWGQPDVLLAFHSPADPHLIHNAQAIWWAGDEFYDNTASFLCQANVAYCRYSDVDECAADPCQNDGYCHNTFGSYQCNCPPGYGGKHCDQVLTSCEISYRAGNLRSGVHTLLTPGGRVFQVFCEFGDPGHASYTYLSRDAITFNSTLKLNLTALYSDRSHFRIRVFESNGVQSQVEIRQLDSNSNADFTFMINSYAGFTKPQALPGFGPYLYVGVLPEPASPPALDTVGFRSNGQPMTVQCYIPRSRYFALFPNSYGNDAAIIGENAAIGVGGWLSGRTQVDLDDYILPEDEFKSEMEMLVGGEPTADCGIQSMIHGWSSIVGVAIGLPFLMIHNCAGAPCQNGGTCSEVANGYECRCIIGYGGLQCHKDVDECADNPCDNGGTCVNTVGSFTCQCVNGYTGRDCDRDYDECCSRPCPMGTVCSTPIFGEHTCSCDETTAGSACERRLDSPWLPVFKGCSGNGQDMYDALSQGQVTSHLKGQVPAVGIDVTRSADCGDHLRSTLADLWGNLGVHRVKVSVYKGQTEVSWIIVDGQGSDAAAHTWLDREKIVGSTFKMADSTSVISGLYVDDTGSTLARRSFYLATHDGCDNDRGWLAVLEPGSTTCGYDNLFGREYLQPAILYSTTGLGDQKWQKELCGTELWSIIREGGNQISKCTYMGERAISMVDCMKHACDSGIHVLNYGGPDDANICYIRNCSTPDYKIDVYPHSPYTVRALTGDYLMADFLTVSVLVDQQANEVASVVNMAADCDVMLLSDPAISASALTDGTSLVTWDSSLCVQLTDATDELIVVDLKETRVVGHVSLNIVGQAEENAASKAFGVTCAASSEYSSQYLCDNAYDGNLGNAASWATLGEGVGGWLRLDFPVEVKVHEVHLLQRCSRQDMSSKIDIRFKDGSIHQVSLKQFAGSSFGDCAGQPWQVFPLTPVTTNSLVFTVVEVYTTTNNGLREVKVMGRVSDGADLSVAILDETPTASLDFAGIADEHKCGAIQVSDTELVADDGDGVFIHCDKVVRGRYVVVKATSVMLGICEIKAFQGSNEFYIGQSWFETSGTLMDGRQSFVTILSVDGGLAASVPGTVVGWRYTAAIAGEVNLQVWRPLAEVGSFQLVGQTTVTVTTPGASYFQLPYGERFPVQVGDVYGFHAANHAVIPFTRCIGSNVYQMSGFSVPPPVGDTVVGNLISDCRRYMFHAVVQPDARDSPWVTLTPEARMFCLLKNPTNQAHFSDIYVTEAESRCGFNGTFQAPETRWRLTWEGHLMNKEGLHCLDYDLYLKDCRLLKAGVWDISRLSTGAHLIRNRILDLCLTSVDFDSLDPSLSPWSALQQETLLYLAGCQVSLVQQQWALANDMFQGGDVYGCYLDDPDLPDTPPPAATFDLSQTREGAASMCLQQNCSDFRFASIRHDGIALLCHCDDLMGRYSARPDDHCFRDDGGCDDGSCADKHFVYGTTDFCAPPEPRGGNTYTPEYCSLGGVPSGGTCTLTCADVGQEPRLGNGNMHGTITCQRGLWDTSVTCQEGQCGPPTPIAGGETNITSQVVQSDPSKEQYPAGTIARDQCLPGYWPMGVTSERVCQRKTQLWSGEMLYCQLMRCGTPPGASKADMAWTDNIYGSEVNYTCREGTRHVSGDLVRTCLGTRLWSGVTPYCEDIVCEVPPKVAHTEMTISGLTFGASVLYRCAKGHQSEASDVIQTCSSDGVWLPASKPLKCLEIRCDLQPPDLEHGFVMEVTGHVMGSRAFYACDLGYRHVSGEMTSVCQESASWSDVSLVCDEVTCNNPPEVPNTVAQFTASRYQATASYQCSEGYHGTTEVQDVVCQADGTWTRTDIECERTRCPDPSPWLSAHSRIVAMTGLGVGETLEVGCAEGYKYIAGSQVWTCLVDGSWQTDDVICEEVVCAGEEEGAGVTCQPTEGRVGHTLTCHCQQTHFPVQGDGERVCLSSGLWTGSALKCQEFVCANLTSDIVDPNMNFDLEGLALRFMVRFSCRDGYEINGSDELTCTPGGVWSAEIPSCEVVDCGPPPSVNHTSVAYNGTTVFSQAAYDCLLTFEPSDGDRYVTCNPEGLWEGAPLKCTPLLCHVPEVTSGSAIDVLDGLVVGATVNYTCEDDMRLAAGDDVRTCQLSGNWSGAAPTCQAIHCPDPASVSNATWRLDRYSRGRKAHYKCFPGHMLVSGDLDTTCGGNGTWIIGDPPVCVADPSEPDSFLPEEVLTPMERYWKYMGMTESDFLPDHVASGSMGVITLLFAALAVVLIDVPHFRREIKERLWPNLKSPWKQRTVIPV